LPGVETTAHSAQPGARISPEPALRITVDEVRELTVRGEPVIFVDARAARSYSADPRQIVGSVRIPPDDPVRSTTEQRLSQRATLVVYCA
jgi:hypothetical protein